MIFSGIMHKGAAVSCVILAAVMLSCGKAENMYSTYRARFSYTPVSAVPNLFRACTSPGEFCSITFPPGQSYVIKSPSTPSSPDYITLTAIQGYRGFVLGVGSGLIVGLPNMPEMLAQESHVTSYDLCCPNCYSDYNVNRHLELHIGGTASCTSCQRHYDMNNQGIISRGNAGRSLFRYYVSYSNPTQTLTINNN